MPFALKTLTLPSPPTPTVTWLACVRDGDVLSTEAFGIAAPAGQTRRCAGSEEFTAVTLSTTALTPLAGTPPTPSTVTSARLPVASAWNVVRVSTSRAGFRAT